MTYSDKAKLFLKMFRGRRDVYGVQTEGFRDGKMVRSFMPVCTNYLSEKCPIKLRTGSCANCTLKVYAPVTEDSVLKHIKGEEAQLQYLPELDGTIWMGAYDFDNKPDKPDQAYHFPEVKRVSDVMNEMGLHHLICRSTGDGWHLYQFFKEPVSAAKFRSLHPSIFAKAGLLQQTLLGIKPLPEIFPKMVAVAPGGVAFGIKPPFIEANMARGKNCPVDSNGEPLADPWKALAEVPLIDPATIDAIIKREGIDVEQIVNAKTHSSVGRNVEWQPSLTGAIEKVLEGCSAFRSVRDKCAKGETLGHFEGMSLWMACMSTADGRDWFKHNVPGWSQTDKDIKQLQHSINKGYSPWGCKKMQEAGICAPGTKCFDRKPRMDMVEGRLVPRDEPESEWPEPSPIRFAHGPAPDFLAKLLKEVEDLKEEKDDETRIRKLAIIIKRASVFDSKQQLLLTDKIEKLKLGKRSQIKKQFSEVNKEKQKELKEIAKSRSDTVLSGNTVFQKLSPLGYASVGNDGNLYTICNFDINIEEDRSIVDDGKPTLRVFVGKFKTALREVPFQVEDSIWGDNSDFYNYFLRLVGQDFIVAKQDVDLLRRASMLWASRTSKRVMCFATQGWHGSSYMMPSTVVDKDGVRENTEKPVDIRGKEHACNLDFKILPDSDVTEILLHIKKDFLNAFPRRSAFLGLGHTLMACLVSYLKIKIRPILWFEGNTGNGKTSFTNTLQKFYGNFAGAANWRTSGNSMTDYGYMFKDALLNADDYKGITQGQTVSAINTVHNAYEYSVVGKLTRDGKQRGDKMCRCLFIMAGQETPENESSFIGRLILIGFEKMDQDKTLAMWKQCEKYSDDYCGITPRFIHWVLQQDRSTLHKQLGEIQHKLMQGIKGRNNDSRIANNVGMALFGWNLFVQFMEHCGAVDTSETSALISEGLEYAEDIRDKMSIRCSGEQEGQVFLNMLIELLSIGKISIENLQNYNNPDGTIVGFVDNKDKDPDTAYLYTGVVMNEVTRAIRGRFGGSTNSVGNQLISMEVVTRHDKGTHTMQKWYMGGNKRVWQVHLNKLGIAGKPRVVNQTEPMELESEIL